MLLLWSHTACMDVIAKWGYLQNQHHEVRTSIMNKQLPLTSQHLRQSKRMFYGICLLLSLSIDQIIYLWKYFWDVFQLLWSSLVQVLKLNFVSGDVAACRPTSPAPGQWYNCEATVIIHDEHVLDLALAVTLFMGCKSSISLDNTIE